MKIVHIAAWILVVIGGLNWGLVGIGSFMGSNLNIVAMIFGSVPMIEGVVYVLVGAAAVFELVTHKNSCRDCSESATM
jgi:uncharacterized protein